MKLYSIKDQYLFKTDQPDGAHTYAVFFDRRRKEYCAVPTTHLYKADQKRFRQKQSGFLKEMKLPGIPLPSGIKDYAHTTDVNGHKISINNPAVKPISKKHLPKRLSSQILDHARGRYTVKKAKKKAR